MTDDPQDVPPGLWTPPSTAPTAAGVQADLSDACTRFLEIATGVRAQAEANGYSPGAAEHIALATYASLVAHLGHAH